METITFTQSNYSKYYNAFQLSLPLDLGIKINPDDEVVTIHSQVNKKYEND